MTIAISGTTGITLDGQFNSASSMGFKNRIINGAMVIDQRNAGASVTLTAANFVYPVDRMFAFRASGTSGAIAQRVLSGITPNGNAIRIQRNSGDSATALLGFGQVIESNNCADLASQSITMSFKARCGANFSAASSQITVRIGTGNGTDQSAANFYNVAWTGQSNTNTAITLTTSFQTFTVTITAGASVSQIGAMLFYTPVGTASTNDWFEVTELQLEKGSTATSFDYRPHGTELALCQRYYYRTPVLNVISTSGYASTSTNAAIVLQFPISLRDAPTALEQSGTATHYTVVTASGGTTACSAVPTFSNSNTQSCRITTTVASGLTAGQAAEIRGSSSSGYFGFSAEL